MAETLLQELKRYVAFGPDGPALYVQFGSAWMRP